MNNFLSAFLSSPRRRRRMDTSPNAEGPYSDRSRILNQEPQFFKVVMFPSNQGLKIPDAFMRIYGRDLQHIVLLKVPTGASWQVELVQYGNRTLLQKGWEEFAKYYCIEMFHFLVFRYLGNSQFLVLIFDPSAVEIEYPVETNSDRRDSCIQTSGQRGSSCVPTGWKVLDVDAGFEEISAEILEKCCGASRASKGKRARVEDIEEEVAIEILDGLTPSQPKTRSSHELIMNHTKSSSNEEEKSSLETWWHFPSSTSKTVTDKEKFRSYEKARAFTSSKPFFISFMQPSYVSHSIMRIPAKFMRNHLSLKKRHFLMLHVSGRVISWPVTVTIHPAGVVGIGACITSGWQRFVQDNGLRVGDVCIFELVLRDRRFNVTIYRLAEDEIGP